MADEKIISITGAKYEPPEREEDEPKLEAVPEVVAFLENWLDLAKQGHIRHIAIAASFSDENCTYGSGGEVLLEPERLYGNIMSLGNLFWFNNIGFTPIYIDDE